MITFSQKGDFSKITEYLKKQSSANRRNLLEYYGKLGADKLMEATPKDTGTTADSWSYEINTTKNKMSIVWNNSNVQDGVPIAVILQYGHGTGTGGYVQGIDYINPALRSVFEQISNDLWEEMTKI